MNVAKVTFGALVIAGAGAFFWSHLKNSDGDSNGVNHGSFHGEDESDLTKEPNPPSPRKRGRDDPNQSKGSKDFHLKCQSELLDAKKNTAPGKLQEVLNKLASGWARSEPFESGYFIVGMSGSSDRDALLAAWAAAVDPNVLAEFLQDDDVVSSEERKLLGVTLTRTARRLTDKELYDKIGDASLDDNIKRSFSGAYGFRGAKRDAALGEMIGDLPNKNINDVASGWAYAQPREKLGATWDQLALAADQKLVSDPSILAGVASRWFEAAPSEALNKIGNLPEANYKEVVVSNIVTTWYEKDPEGMSVWLNGLRPGGSKDVGVAAMIPQLIADGDVENAEKWVGEIRDPHLRAHSTKVIESSSSRNSR